MSIEIEEVDGITRVRHRPSRATLSLPTYFEWCRLLVQRGAAVQFTDGFRIDTNGQRVPRFGYKLCEQSAEVDDAGTVTLRCISCAEPFTPRSTGTGRHGIVHYNTIRIGTLIRMEEEEQTSFDRIEVRTVRKPVSKRGYGCDVCAEIFRQETYRVNNQNKIAERIHLLHARMKDQGLSVVGKAPAIIEPWIDIVELERERAEAQ